MEETFSLELKHIILENTERKILSDRRQTKLKSRKSYRKRLHAVTCFKCLRPNHPACHVLRLLELPIFLWSQITLLLMYCIDTPEGPALFMDFWTQEELNDFFKIVPAPNGTLYWNGNLNPDVIKPKFIAKTLNIPNRVYYHMFVLIRLTASCFVGIEQYGLDATDYNSVLLYISMKMLIRYVFLVLPIYLLEIWWKISKRPICIIICHIYMSIISILRYSFLLQNDYKMTNSWIFFRLSRYMNCIILLEMYSGLLFLLLPYVMCSNGFLEKKFNFFNCYDYDCIFFKLNLDECLNGTWFGQVNEVFAQFPFVNVDKSSKELIDLTRFTTGFPHVLYDLALLYIWSVMRRNGYGPIYPSNSLEKSFFLGHALFGYFVLSWSITGLICAYFYNTSYQEILSIDHISLIESYCQINEFGVSGTKYFKKYYFLQDSNKDILLKNEQFRQMPSRHKEVIRYNSYVKVLKSTRIFNNIDNDFLHCLTYFLKMKCYLAGETIVNCGSVPPGLFIIRKGVVQVIALSPISEAGMSQLERGDCFGEINICKDLRTPLLFIAKSDCYLWTLSRVNCMRVTAVIPKIYRKDLFRNHYEIVRSAKYMFQKPLKIISPTGLPQAIKIYCSVQPTRFPLELCEVLEEIEEKHSWTDKSKFYSIWNCFIGFFALCFWAFIFVDVLPYDAFNIFFPNLVFLNGDVKQIYAIFFVLTFICLVDFIIWITIKIWSDQDLLSGTQALKFKFKQELRQTLGNICSIFFFGFKINTLIEVAHRKIPWNYRHWIIICLILLLLFTTLHYSVRAFSFLRLYRNYCDYYQKVLNITVCSKLDQINGATCLAKQCQLLYNKTNGAIFLSNACSNISSLSVNSPPLLKELLLDKRTAKAYSYVISSQVLITFCNEYFNWSAWEDLVRKYYTNLFIHYLSYTFFWGNLFTYTVFNDLFCTSPLIISTLFSLFASASINGKFSSHSLARYDYYKEYNKTVKILKNLLPTSEELLQKQCISYFRLNYLDYNRISIYLNDNLIEMPEVLKKFGKIKKKVSKMKFGLTAYDVDSMNNLLSSLKFVFFPPGFTIWSSHSRLSLLYIIKGFCVSIDNLGIKTNYGPNDLAGLLSIYTKKQLSTLIAQTYVMGMLLKEEDFLYLLKIRNKMLRIRSDLEVRIAPAMEFVLRNYKKASMQEEKVKNKCISEYRKDFDFPVKKKKSCITDLLFFRLTILNYRIQIFINCFLMGMIYLASVWVSLYQAQFLDNRKLFWTIHSIIDSFIMLDGYFVFQQNLKDSQFSIKLFSIVYNIFIVFPLDIFFLSFPVKYFILLRTYRLIRILEPFRRISAFKKLCPEYLNIIFGWEAMYRVLIQICIISWAFCTFHCSPVITKSHNHICTNVKALNYLIIPKGIDDVKTVLLSFKYNSDLNEIWFPETIYMKDNEYPNLINYVELLNHSTVSYSLPIAFVPETHRLVVNNFNFDLYSLNLYKTINMFTLTGLTITSLSNYPVIEINFQFWVTIIAFCVGYLHAVYILANIAGIYSSVDHNDFMRMQELKDLKFFLKSKGIDYVLIKQATSNLEFYLSSREFLLKLMTNECIGPNTLTRIYFDSYQGIYKKLGFIDSVPLDQLYLASEMFKKVFICSNQVIFNEGQIVDSITILFNGSVQVIPNRFKNKKISTKSSKKYEYNLTSDKLIVGDCIGIRNINPAQFKLEIWPYNLITAEDCVFLKIMHKDLDELKMRAELFVTKLYEASENTFAKIKSLNQVQLESVSLVKKDILIKKNIFKRYIQNRNILHPASSSINVFLIIVTSIQFLILMWCSLSLGVLMTPIDLKNFLGFINVNRIYKRIAELFILPGICCVIQFLLSIHCGYYDEKLDLMILDPELVWKHAKGSKPILILLLSIQPIGIICSLYGFTKYEINVILSCCPIGFQLYSIMMYYKLKPYSLNLAKSKEIIKTSMVVLLSLTVLTIVWMCTTCMIQGCKISWIGLMDPNEDKFNSVNDFIILSLSMVCNVVGNIGGGYIKPQNVLERLFSCFLMLFGFFMGGYFQAMVMSKFNTMFMKENEKRLKISIFSKLLEKNGLEEKKIALIMNYINYSSLGSSEDWEFDKILSNMHTLLACKITYGFTESFLKQLFLLKKLGNSCLQYISNYIKSELFLPGDVIIKEGDVVFKAYYVFHGSCNLTFSHGSCFVFNKGSVFCEKFLYSPNRASFSVKASQFCICYSLHHEILTQILISLAKFHIAVAESNTRSIIYGFTITEKSSLTTDSTECNNQDIIKNLEIEANFNESYEKPFAVVKSRLFSIFQQRHEFFEKLAWKFVHSGR